MALEKIHFLKKFYLTSWAISAFLLLGSVLYYNLSPVKNNFGVNIYDTYYIVGIFEVLFLLSLFYFLIGFGYWLVKKVKGRLSRILCFIHAFIMLTNILLFAICLATSTTDFSISSSYFTFGDWQSAVLVACLIAVLFIAQPLYVINLMLGIFYWRKDRSLDL